MTDPDAPKLHVFSQDELRKAVNDALPLDVKPGEHVLVGVVDQRGAQAIASFKFHEDRWELQAAARHDWNGENSVGAKVLLRWGGQP